MEYDPENPAANFVDGTTYDLASPPYTPKDPKAYDPEYQRVKIITEYVKLWRDGQLDSSTACGLA